MVTTGDAGILKAGRLRWLRALGWMVVLAAAMLFGFNLVARGTLLLLAGGEFTTGAAAPAGHKLLAASLGAIAILLLYGIAVRAVERRPVPELGLRPLVPEILLGSAIGALLMMVIVGTLWLFGWAVVEPRSVEGVAIALRDSIRSGVVEEVLLRLVIFRLAWRAFGVWPALAIASLMFGALHLGNPDSSLFAAVSLIAGRELRLVST